MKVSVLLGVLAACVTTNAFSFDDILQKVLPKFLNQVVWSDTDVFAAQLEAAGLDPQDVDPRIASAWEHLQATMSSNAIQRKVDEYLSEGVSAAQLHNTQSFKTAASPEFESFSAPEHQGYNLRVKENHPEALGLDTVKQYTGYLDVLPLDKHFFYWFFESRNDPKNDPVILWLNGGPGCSSATGLFFELGPSLINATLQPVFNPYSWNSNASVIFLDQPVGVGYSYTGGEQIKDTASAAKDVFVFLELFFQKFSHFRKNDFHIAGESYAGHYIPAFALEIVNRADRSFDLTSVLIGNGITDSLIQYGSYKPMTCGEGGYKPVLDEETCAKMEEDYPKCAFLVKACYSFPSPLTCVPAELYCEQTLFRPYSETGLNPYDIRKKCEDEGGLCYTQMEYIDDYLNLDYVKKTVGANVDIFTSCDDTVFGNFIKDGDGPKPFQGYVAELLEKDIPVLLYAGDKDVICNWIGNHDWSDALPYSDHEQFEAAPLKPWITSNNKVAGEVKNVNKFTFLRVYDAGHMVPFDQPENSLDMVNRWIQGDYAFGYKK